ncbi:MAG TPA: hypothetical protein VKB04_09445 [Anaerolineales bacterium]|nr:hypothetical protein [Anaerolineales bacterium]
MIDDVSFQHADCHVRSKFKDCRSKTGKVVKMKKYQASFLAGVFLLMSSCSVARATPTPDAQGANSIVISTFTAAPANSPAPSEILTSTAEPTPNLKIIGQLPGLSPANVTVRLEQQNFTCTQVKKGAVYYERSCIKGLLSTALLRVVISGREPFIVDFIETSIRQNENSDNKIATELLSFMATLPYDGAAPEDARKWIENTIPTLSGNPDDAQEGVFGGVKYVLSGLPMTLMLEMGELP